MAPAAGDPASPPSPGPRSPAAPLDPSRPPHRQRPLDRLGNCTQGRNGSLGAQMRPRAPPCRRVMGDVSAGRCGGEASNGRAHKPKGSHGPAGGLPGYRPVYFTADRTFVYWSKLLSSENERKHPMFTRCPSGKPLTTPPVRRRTPTKTIYVHPFLRSFTSLSF